MQQLFGLLVCGFEFYMSYLLFDHFFREKAKSWLYKLGILAMVTLLLFIINTTAGKFFINSISTIVLISFMALSLFEGHIGKKLLLSFASACIAVLSELVTGFAASALLEQAFENHMEMPAYAMFFTIISKMVHFFVVQLIITFVGKSLYGNDRKESFYLLLCPTLAILNMYVLMHLDTGRQTHVVEHSAVFVLGIGWLAVSIILLKVYNAACERYELAQKLQAIEIQKQAEVEYLHRQKMNEQMLRQIMHDIKNQLLNTQSLIETNPQQGIECLNQCILSLSEKPNMQITADYHNLVFNQILNKSKETCEQLGIELILKIEYGDLGFLCVMDTSAIFDNAFDNAIYACNEIPKEQKRSIQLNVYRSGDMVNITVKNTMLRRLQVSKEKQLSSKEDSVNHGFGLRSIRAAAERYRGIAITECSDNEHILTVSINMNKV